MCFFLVTRMQDKVIKLWRIINTSEVFWSSNIQEWQ
jgi:hypothetical protein